MSLDANLRGVHPILEFRIRGLLSEPALKRYGTYPAVRTYAKQKALRDRYLRGGNLAASPDRVLRTGKSFPYAWKPRGSWHMEQADGYGHAVDLKRPLGVSRSQADKAVRPYLAKWGLKQTVWPKEWWHVQALTSQGWIDGPLPESSGMFLTYDSSNDEYRVGIPGEGTAVIDSPNHWREVIAKGRMTGVYESPHMQALLNKIRKEAKKK